MEHTFTARVLFALVRSHRREHQHVPDLSVGATVASQQGGKQSRFSRDGARAPIAQQNRRSRREFVAGVYQQFV